MSALAKSPLADAMREAGLSEDQVKAALEAAANAIPAKRLAELRNRAATLHAVAEIHNSNHGGNWMTIHSDAGRICFWPASAVFSAERWSLDVETSAPDAAPSLMARAQSLYDLYRQLVTQ